MNKNKKLKRSKNFERNKKVIILFIVGLVLIILIVFAIAKALNPKNNGSQYIVNSYIDSKESKYIVSCRNEEECYRIPDGTYSILHLKNDYPKLNEKVDVINQRTTDLYKRASKAKTDDDPLCVNARKSYTYRYIDEIDYQTYENDKYVSVMADRSYYDACLDVTAEDDDEAYIYDIKKKKIISQDEFAKALKVTDKEINDAINVDIKFIKDNFGNEFSVDNNVNKVLFYDYYGNLLVSYRFLESGKKYKSIVRESNISIATTLVE